MYKKCICVLIASLLLCQNSFPITYITAAEVNESVPEEEITEADVQGEKEQDSMKRRKEKDIELNSLDDVEGEPDDKAKIRLNAGNLRRIVGDTFELKVRITLSSEGKSKSEIDEYNVSFESSNPEVAEVTQTSSKNAVIEGKGVGTATIRADVRYGSRLLKTLKCSVKVGPQAQSIKMVKSKIVLRVNKKTMLRTIVKPGTTVEMPRFKSMNPSIATVSSNGMVTARKKGKTKIVATLSNGAKDSCIIRVKAKKA